MSNENKKERKKKQKDGHIVLNSNSFKLGLAMGSPLGCDPLLALQIWFASVCGWRTFCQTKGEEKKKAKQKKEKKKKKYVQEELRHRANKRGEKKLVSYP